MVARAIYSQDKMAGYQPAHSQAQSEKTEVERDRVLSAKEIQSDMVQRHDKNAAEEEHLERDALFPKIPEILRATENDTVRRPPLRW